MQRTGDDRSGGWRGAGSRLALASATGFLLLASCITPDRPAGLVPDLPDGAIRFLEPDQVRSDRLGPGVFYRFVRSPGGPWTLHFVEMDLSLCGSGLAVVRAPGARGTGEARMRVADLFDLAPEGAVAAVNGDFFIEGGVPSGVEVSTTGRRGTGSAPALLWDARTGPSIGRARAAGDDVHFDDRPLFSGPSPPSGIQVVSGFPELLDAGERVGDLEVSARPDFAASRHPRSAIGLADEGRRLWIVVVEGRGADGSAGMTLPELTQLLEKLGVDEALNLDGGGSSAMVLGSRASGGGFEVGAGRPVVNALVVLAPGARERAGVRSHAEAEALLLRSCGRESQ